MFLYRLEACLSDRVAEIIVIAESDEQAFEFAEVELVRYFVSPPVCLEMSLLEKKRTNSGAGFVVERRES